jgi:hypothetical protein
MGQGSGELRLRYYIAQVDDLPEGFNPDSVLEDKLEINSIDWTILNAELIIDRICIFEVTRQ